MNSKFFQFECLPNEIIFDIFKYLDTQNLFRSFYNLNSYFNTLLQSVNDRSLILKTSIDQYEYFASYIDILVIDGKLQVNLSCFKNLRRLILIQPTDEVFQQLKIKFLPHLEHLYIRIRNQRDNNYSYIFSDGFPNLKTCCIYKPNLLTDISSWPQLSSLYILKLSDINLYIYKSILLSCPNLNFLKFTRIKLDIKSIGVIHHNHLKKLVIVIPWFEELDEDYEMNIYFSCLPKLERLTIHRTNESRSINECFLKYNWYIPLIKTYLLSLRTHL